MFPLKKKLSRLNKIELLKTTFHRYQITVGNKAICLLIAIIRHLTDQTMYNIGQVRYSKYGGSVCNWNANSYQLDTHQVFIEY